MADDFSFSDLLKQAEQQGGSFDPLPNGEYETTVEQADARKTATGKSKIVVRYKVAGGPYNGRTIYNDHVLTPSNPNAMIIFFRQMSALGLKSDYFAQNPSLDQVAAALVGKKARLRLGTREWQSVKRNSVLAIMSATGGPGTSSPLPGANLIPQPSFSVPPLPSLPTTDSFEDSVETVVVEEIEEAIAEAVAEEATSVSAPPSLPF